MRCSGTSSLETSLARRYANAVARLALEVGVRWGHPAHQAGLAYGKQGLRRALTVPDAPTAHPLAPNYDGAPIASRCDPVQISG